MGELVETPDKIRKMRGSQIPASFEILNLNFCFEVVP